MFLKKPEYIILDRCKSFSINRKKKFKNLNNDKHKPGLISITSIHSPINSPKLIESKSQTNFFTKTIKISFNKYHNYIKKIDNKKNNNFNQRPFSLNINKNIRNNRQAFEKKYPSQSRNKLIFNNFNSSFKERTIFSSNNNSRKKLNLLNFGINSPVNKNSNFNNKIYNSFLDNNSILSGIETNMSRKISSLTLNEQLKNSKFFNKTKYINGIKNKNNVKRNKRSSLSTYNILLEPNQEDFIYNALNEIIIKHLINNNNKLYEKIEKRNITPNNKYNPINEQINIEKAQYFDILPIILNHIKQKKTMDDLYKEYNKYLSNITETTINNQKTKINNPIIRYLFLENVLNNLKHIVKFIDIQNKEEIEQNVIKIIGEEYKKLEEDKSYSINKDFLTHGFEYIPKFRDSYNYTYLMDKGLQTSKFSDKKSIFFINEKKIEENNTFSNNEVISPTRKIFLKNSVSKRRKLDFETKKFEERKKLKEELKNEINEIFSHYPIEKEKVNTKNKNNKTKKNEILKANALKNLMNIQKKPPSPKKKVESDNKKPNKSPFLKININKLKINEIINQQNNNVKRHDSTDKMVNPPSLERLNNKNEEDKNKKRKSVLDDEHKPKKIKVINSTLTNIYLAKKTKEDKNKIEKKPTKNLEDKKEKSQHSSEEENAGEQAVLSKENLENLKKTTKFTRKYKKALKDKKKMEKEYKNTLENNEIALREIRKVEKQRRKKKASVFNELMNQNKRHSILNLLENDDSKKINKDENYSSISSSEIQSQLERMKQEIEYDDNINDIESNINEEKKNSLMISSVSEISNDLEEFNEVKEIIKPKTVKEAFDDEKRKASYRRRGGVIIPTPEVFKNIIKIKEISDLNDKMKKLYDHIYREKKKDEFKKKRKKHYIYSFIGVDLNNIKDVEKKKRAHLSRIKEDIKNKIIKGNYHFAELEHFKVFERAMNNINLSKLEGDPKRIKEYVHTLEKYFQLFYYELLTKERQKRDEDRINKFLYNLQEEVGVTVPYVKFVKGKRCRSTDYNIEANLSEFNSSNNK